MQNIAGADMPQRTPGELFRSRGPYPVLIKRDRRNPKDSACLEISPARWGIDYLTNFRLKPMIPTRPDPRSHTAAGMGTGGTNRHLVETGDTGTVPRLIAFLLPRGIESIPLHIMLE